jgi:3-hydroxypropanoate dehydrogenase
MNMNTTPNTPTGDELAKLRIEAQQDVRNLKSEITKLDDASIKLILTGARSHYAWTDKPIADDIIHKLYDIVKMGSTSMNGCPAR